MRSIREYIVHVPEKYEDRWLTKDPNVVIYKDTTVADTFDAIREGKVVCVPDNIENPVVRVGDTIIFHHNIVYEQIMRDRRIVSDFCIDEQKHLYRIPQELCYGYYRDGLFNAIPGFVFVEPITNKVESQLIISTEKEKEIKEIGRIKYGYEQLGLEKDDVVVFAPWSQYPYYIDRVKLYRMKDKDILAVWDKKGTYPNINLE